MLHIRTLGVAEIVIDDEQVGVEQPMVFTLLFFLAMRSRASVSRRELADLLWPGAADPDRNHRLRSLLHRVRRLGAPLSCSSTTVALEHSTIDFRNYVAPPVSIADIRARIASLGPVLPHLAALPPALADRLEPERDVIVATTTRWLLAAVGLAKASGDWSLVEEAARRARDIDPDNETAARSLAEARCLTAQKPSGAAQLIGRVEIMHRIWSAAAGAGDGNGAALLLWGPAGIGKTRVLTEAARLSLHQRARVVSMAARPVHALRPLALILDLARRLLDEPGAAGCDPVAYRSLRLWMDRAAPNEVVTPLADVELFDAFIELLSALSDESPIVLIIDDMHLADHEVWRLLRALIRWSADRRILWLFAYRALRDAELSALPEESVVRRIALPCLEPDAARMLVVAVSPSTSGPTVDQILNVAGGHPLVLCEAARSRGTLPAHVHRVLDDGIARLSHCARRMLRLIASVGGSATLCSLAESAPLGCLDLSAALDELEGAGMVRREGEVFHVYGAWIEAALMTLAGSEHLMISSV